MGEILLFLVFGVLAFYAGWKVHEMFIIHVIKVDPEVIEEALKIAKLDKESLHTEQVSIETDDGTQITTEGVEISIEVVNGVMYAYGKSNNKFIAQGETVEALLKTAHERFPGQTFFGNLP